MLVWRSLGEVPRGWGGSVVAIGVFDGVHAGHRAIVARARAAADDIGARVVVISFDPHPAAVVRPDAAPLMLTTVEQRARLLAAAGADAMLALPFTPELSRLSPAEFVDEVLVDGLHTVRVVVGGNFRFGHKAAGDVQLLAELGRQCGFAVDAVSLVGDDDPVSSTLVRRLVADGDVAGAARALGRPHAVAGPVVRGEGRGRGLGYPTANVDVAEGTAVPGDGVYAGWLVRADGTRLPAAISVGTNPTFDGIARTVEAYVLDADLDLYDEVVSVEFEERLRGMERFDGVGPLVAQMDRDVARTREIVG